MRRKRLLTFRLLSFHGTCDMIKNTIIRETGMGLKDILSVGRSGRSRCSFSPGKIGMKGIIIRGIAGFYYVYTDGADVWECKARGIFRKDGRKPLVGDRVEIRVLHEADMEASITEILPRKNELVRPAAANVDQAMVFFALKNPDPDSVLLDRFLVMMEQQDIPVFICLNKTDLVSAKTADTWKKLYESCGYRVIVCSAGQGDGVDEIRRELAGKTTVIAGPSGAGKSTLVNLLQTEIRMDTGEISRKLKRGRHTTRRAELIPVAELQEESGTESQAYAAPGTWIIDTPGFTSYYIPDMEKEQLRFCFPEFRPYEGSCRFLGCVHMEEPDCAVRGALLPEKEGVFVQEDPEAASSAEPARHPVSRERYAHYRMFFEELKEQERRRY